MSTGEYKISDLSISELALGLRKRDFSSVELTRLFLEKIEKNDKDVFAFLSVDADSAMIQAGKADERLLEEKDSDLLCGIPCAIKDNILVEGMKCTAGSKILENYTAPYSATVVEKLKEKGAVILGKTNMDEFAMGASGENSAFGPTKNPVDLERVPGGSSSGSAVCVASGMAAFALGSDTAGSIRQPASFCGIAGLKPTYGAVSRNGLIAMASSLDQIGPLAKTAKDCEIIFNAIKGCDDLDSTSFGKAENGKEKFETNELKIGVPKEYFVKGINSEVEKVIRAAVKKYEEMGADVCEVSLPHTEYAIAAYYILTPCEISANTSRYDGIKYGFSYNEGKDLLDVYLKSRAMGFGSEVRRRIMLGDFALSVGHYEAYYLKAQKVRALIRKDFEDVFKKVDVLMAPVSPFPAFKLGEKVDDPLSMYLCDAFTGPVSLAGLPALSLPVGKAENLPVGLQIIGNYFEEKMIFDVAKAFQE